VTKGKDMGKTFACASPKIYGVEWERVGSGVGGAPAQSLSSTIQYNACHTPLQPYRLGD